MRSIQILPGVMYYPDFVDEASATEANVIEQVTPDLVQRTSSLHGRSYLGPRAVTPRFRLFSSVPHPRAGTQLSLAGAFLLVVNQERNRSVCTATPASPCEACAVVEANVLDHPSLQATGEHRDNNECAKQLTGRRPPCSPSNT